MKEKCPCGQEVEEYFWKTGLCSYKPEFAKKKSKFQFTVIIVRL